MTLSDINALPEAVVAAALAKCCGATAWVSRMVASRPFVDEPDLFSKAHACWNQCGEADGWEAFAHHPRIGGAAELAQKFASTRDWASGEQSGVQQAPEAVLQALAEGNRAYEEKFGYIFIVCATGKRAEEMLALLQARLPNPPQEEIRIAMAEQMKITVIRLQKLLTP